MAYESKYTGAEVDALLDKVNEGEAITVDSSLSTESENPVQNKVVTEELNKKANTDGKYPDLMAGDLVGRGESVPAEFSFRASGGKSIKDGTAWIKRLKGNSVVWNQKYPTDWSLNALGLSVVSSNNVISISGTATDTYIRFNRFEKNEVNHIYLFDLSGASENLNGKTFSLANRPSSGNPNIINGYAPLIYHNTEQEQQNDRFIAIRNIAIGDVINEPNLVIRQIDLTQMFGAGNEPTTIEEFYARKPIVADEYAYNEGEVIHMIAEGIKSVGDNAWGGTLERGKLTNGNDSASAEMLRSIDYVRVLPSQEYYVVAPQNEGQVYFYPSFYDSDKNYIGELQYVNNFTTPSNAAYMRFFLYDTSGSAIPIDYEGLMITLVHSGWKQDTDAGYQPYWQDILPLPIISKYFPDGMKKAGTAHDKIRFNKASGKWEAVQGIGSVDMGTLDWTLQSFGFSVPTVQVRAINMAFGDPMNLSNCLCNRYSPAPTYDLANLDKVMRMPIKDAYNEMFTIKDTSYTDVESFKADMVEVILYYELAEPIVTELDEADQNFRDYYQVADFGTEQAIAEQPSAPISADIIYQFNAVDMIREHEIEINELQSIIATMQAQLASLTSNNG